MSMSNTNRHYLAGDVSLSKQRGMSFIGLLCIMCIVAVIGMFAFKIGPSYMEFLTVQKIAEDLSKNDELLKETKSKIVKHINQSYNTNNLWDLKAKDTIELKKDARLGYLVTVNYEKRANLFGNIDVVTVFHKAMNE